MKPEQSPVAILGLGVMGSSMARRLLGAGFPVTVYNRSPARAAPLKAAGARVAATPAEAASASAIVLSMLADDAACRGVWLGGHGALAAAPKDAVLLESSTVTVGWVHELAAAARARGLELLDAPVTGSKLQAAAGELNFLIGGSAAALERARPALEAMSRTITHLGPTGSGSLMKLVNNFLCGVQVASLAEAVALIEKGGLDRAKALEILYGGAPGSPMVKALGARMHTRDYTVHFVLRLMGKDLLYAQREAGLRSLNLATGSAALSVFNQAIAAGYGEKDMSAVVEPYRQDGPARAS